MTGCETGAFHENDPSFPAGGSCSYLDGAAYCVSSLRTILPPFITNLTR